MAHAQDHDDHTHDDHNHGSELAPMDLRVRALESLLVEKGYVDPAALDALIETYETRVGPHNGARVVARAWVDPAFRARLLADATPAIRELGIGGRGGEHMVVVENTPQTHNLVVCTLCSCYPWPVLGLPPVWYKSPPYRARAVIEPRVVLAEFGVTLPANQGIRVWDSTAELRYMVLPMRPAGTDDCDETTLAALVTRDSMIGTGLARSPGERGMNGGQDLGGMHGFGAIAPEADEPRFHAPWERRVFGLAMAMGLTGAWNLDASRSARESLPPGEYLTASYYAIWLKALERQVVAHGLATAEELACGRAATPAASMTRVLRAEEVAPLFARGFPSDRPVPDKARFTVGEPVRARNLNPAGHIRLPRYVRGHVGTVETVHGGFVFPDTNARLAGEHPQWLYTVRFAGRDLWGEAAETGHAVSVNAFESYLEPVT